MSLINGKEAGLNKIPSKVIVVKMKTSAAMLHSTISMKKDSKFQKERIFRGITVYRVIFAFLHLQTVSFRLEFARHTCVKKIF